MKNALLALALFAFVGSAAAHDGKGPHDHGKKVAGGKSACTKDMAGKSGCCMKGKATAAAATDVKAAPVTKSL